MISATAQKALNYYGGAELWQNSRYIAAEVSVTGLAFILKRQPFFKHARIVMETDRPRSQLTPVGRLKNLTGVLDGHNVWLEDERGNIVAKREHARTFFPYGRRLLYWDDLDMAYFANYAFWNYFTFPRLLMNEQITWQEKRPGLLQAEFPDSLPTHCRSQEFLFDEVSGRLLQHNYTADVISKLARVGHVVTAHAQTNGLQYPSARKVTPRSRSGNVLAAPVMININVHNYELISQLHL